MNAPASFVGKIAWIAVLSLGVLGAASGGTIVVTPTTNATTIVNALTAGGGQGIVVTAVSLKSQALFSGEMSSGTYSLTGAPPTTYEMTLPGIILSSGNVADYGTGPYLPGNTTAYGVPATPAQEALLNPITGVYPHFDVTQLDITFNTLPGFDKVFFQVVFGSEEYPDFVGSPFVDGFGLYLNGTNIAYTEGLPININHPSMAAIPGTALTGVLAPGGHPIMTFSKVVGNGSVGNKLTIIISDTSDSVLDTTIYVQALGGSLPTQLSFKKTVDSDIAVVGSNLTFSLNFKNAGTGLVQNVVVTDTLPPALTYVSSAADSGSCSVSNNTVTCALGNVPGGSTAQATITVVPTQIGDICNTATATSTNDGGGTITDQACVSVVPGRNGQCLTRSARFWFTHTHSTDPDCATLLGAIDVNGGVEDLGFMQLPVRQENGDGILGSADALIEALGFYYRNLNYTGEDSGTQNQSRLGSKLCRARKQLAVELIAAKANFTYLRTFPTDCHYTTGRVTTNFPLDMIAQASAVGSGTDLALITTATAFLHKFNNNGLTNNFVDGLKECAPDSSALLRKVSRDPTTHTSCPGLNDTCASAEAITAPYLPFSRSVDLRNYSDGMISPTCGVGGPNAVWKLDFPTAAAGRHFTVDTKGSNFATMISVWRGSCDNFQPVTCAVGTTNSAQARLSFTTDGTVSYYIVIENPSGQVGKLKMKVTSP